MTEKYNNRLGVHYYPDTEHYSIHDMNRWLPILQSLKISWITLIAPLNRAIPEEFIQSLVNSGINPILHFIPPSIEEINLENLDPLLVAYASWGIKYVAVFERQNLQFTWKPGTWSQDGLIENFLDRFIPVTHKLISYGFKPIFPPLEPGGEYWDTAFLRTSLESLQRRNEIEVLDNLVLGAYGFRHAKSWLWGAGGPDKWPESRPYLSSNLKQDHRGFFIFDWYSAISEAVLGIRLPVMLLRAGAKSSPLISSDNEKLNKEFTKIYKALKKNISVTTSTSEKSKSQNLLGSCFWLMSAPSWSQYKNSALFTEEGSPTDSGKLFLHPGQKQISSDWKPVELKKHPLERFILYSKEFEAQFDKPLQKMAKDFGVSFGSSSLAAIHAKQVIIFGNMQSFSEDTINHLKKSGCNLISCENNGIELARILASY